MFGWTGRTKQFEQMDQSKRGELVHRYIAAMETEQSKDWCRCIWAVHPDDQSIKQGHCRLCTAHANAPQHHGLPEDKELGEAHNFKGKRMRKVGDHPDCPVHTREGLILYFFEWAEKNGD